MKSVLKKVAWLVLAALALAVFGCKTDTETEWKDKIYCSAVTFTSEVTADGVKVTMATTTEGAVIYYTTDGTLPTEKSTKYSEAVEFTKDATVKAIAIKEGIENSPVSIATVSIKEKTIIADETAPKDVKNFAVVNKDAAALLTWKDPADSDLFGIEVTYGTSTSSSAISVMEKESIFVSPGTENAVITGLTNGTLYTFTVKAMDLSGNKS
ncbi:MAG: chitobiase/beta-hexosaminidase C-terminal domain-containing protein, partial [Treponema sp.]|nr:chitobiase/beta-hexosaminidase C-terminal domain-containing protein [Treponema sp.]